MNAPDNHDSARAVPASHAVFHNVRIGRRGSGVRQGRMRNVIPGASGLLDQRRDQERLSQRNALQDGCSTLGTTAACTGQALREAWPLIRKRLPRCALPRPARAPKAQRQPRSDSRSRQDRIATSLEHPRPDGGLCVQQLLGRSALPCYANMFAPSASRFHQTHACLRRAMTAGDLCTHACGLRRAIRFLIGKAGRTARSYLNRETSQPGGLKPQGGLNLTLG